MPFPVDYETTIDDVTIKCSKPFNELGSITVNDLLPYAISGIHDIGVGRASLSCESFSNYTDIENNTPVEYINSSWSDVRVKYHTEYNPFRANPHYGFTILAYGTEWQCIKSATDNARLVLDIPIQKIFVDMPTYSKQTINKVNDGDASTVDSIDWYTTSDTGKIRTVSNNTEIPNLQILTVFVLSDSNFIIMNTTGQKGSPFVHTTYAWHGNTSNASGGTSGTTVFLPYYSTTYLGNTARYVNMANDDALNGNTFGSVDWSRHFTVLFDTPDNEHEQTNSYVVVTYTGAGPPDFNGTVTFYPKGGERSAMLGFANSCLKFKYGLTMYKPLISGGAVYDYTDDMDAESEFDDITTVTGNNVPLVPPSPPLPIGDDMESMATGASGSSGGFTHFYIMSAQDLVDFLADFYTRASSGETLTNNLVCSYILGIPSSEFCATEEVEIAIHNSAQGTPFISQAKYSHITATNNLLVIGSFTVPRITKTFYDFAPYSTYEVFIPCCGWVSLPDTVAGRTINVEMYIDVASCCLKAAVKINDLGVCAVTNGVLGASIPIAVIESGILRGNNIQAGLGIIGGGINTGIGAGSGNAMGIGFGVQQILNGLVECTVAGNTNYTQQKGGTGDITQFAMGHKCYMKVTHPEIDAVVNNSVFGHSVGYLCNRIGKLNLFKGFTVCGNPHVTFSASAEEREEIERLLSMGVIL